MWLEAHYEPRMSTLQDAAGLSFDPGSGFALAPPAPCMALCVGGEELSDPQVR